MEQIVLDLKLSTAGAEQSIDQLESSLKQMRDQIKSVPSDSQAFKTLQTNIQKTDSQLKNVNKSLEGFGKAQLAESLGKIVGGASAAVAGFGLLSQSLGATKESAEEMQRSFNAAFGIINGVKGMVEVFQGLGTLLPGVLTKFKALDTAMKFSVIGIIALAVGGLVIALGSLSDAEEEASEATENYNKKLEQQQKLIADLWVEVQNLTNAKNIYNDTVEQSLKTQKQHLEDFNDLIELVNTYTNLQDKSNLSIEEQTEYFEKNKDAIDIKRLSDEELEKVINKLTSANDKFNESVSSQLVAFNSTKDAAASEVISIQELISKKEKQLITEGKLLKIKELQGTIGFGDIIKYKTLEEELVALRTREIDATNNLGLAIKALDGVKNQLYEEDAEAVGTVLPRLLEALQKEANIRGIILKSVEDEKTRKERLAAQREKEIQRQRELNDLLEDYAYLQRENDIRITNEGIDIAEKRDIALLKREEEFSNAKKEIDRNETLNKQQKADAYLAIDEQYRLDLIDINADYDKQEQDVDEQKIEQKKKNDEEEAAYVLDQKKRLLAATSEAEYLQSNKDLQDQIEYLNAQRDLELMNTNLTEEEKYLIRLKYQQKINDLNKTQSDKELEIRNQNLTEMFAMYEAFTSVISALQEGALQKFQQNQDEQLEVFSKSQESQYQEIENKMAMLEHSAEFESLTVREQAELRDKYATNLAAEEKRLAAEKEQFEIQQAERLKERQKKQANLELGLLVGQSIANIAAAILKAQVNPGFPLSIAEMIRISALGITQVAAITSQINKINSFRSGGVISGPSHEGGGVKFAVGGQVNELEGGEGVINKRSMSMPGVSQAASYLNQLGGGVAFDTSSIKNTPVATLSSLIATNGSQIIRAYVLEGDITDKQKLNERIRSKAKF